MPSTRKQKGKSRKTTDVDILSDYGNMDDMLGERKSNSLESELDDVLNGPDGQQDSESVPNREGSSQENEIRDILTQQAVID